MLSLSSLSDGNTASVINGSSLAWIISVGVVTRFSLATGLALFNREGGRNVTTNRIAEALENLEAMKQRYGNPKGTQGLLFGELAPAV